MLVFFVARKVAQCETALAFPNISRTEYLLVYYRTTKFCTRDVKNNSGGTITYILSQYNKCWICSTWQVDLSAPRTKDWAIEPANWQPKKSEEDSHWGRYVHVRTVTVRSDCAGSHIGSRRRGGSEWTRFLKVRSFHYVSLKRLVSRFYYLSWYFVNYSICNLLS